jgi:hypothetical protein
MCIYGGNADYRKLSRNYFIFYFHDGSWSSKCPCKIFASLGKGYPVFFVVVSVWAQLEMNPLHVEAIGIACNLTSYIRIES